MKERLSPSLPLAYHAPPSLRAARPCGRRPSRSRAAAVWLLLAATTAPLGLSGCSTESPAEQDLGTVRQAVGEMVSTDKGAYTVGENVIVSFANLPGNAQDWVALSPAGSPATSFTRWAYTFGTVTGTRTFSSPPAGNYVARAYEAGGFNILAQSAAFTIAAQTGVASISTNKASYQTSENVTVSYSGMGGYNTDWISIAPQGSAANAFVRWAYTSAQLSGTAQFALGGLSGTYVARAHFNNGFNIEAESAPFTVSAAGTTVSPSKSTYALAEPIVLSFANMLGSSTDWISISLAGSADDSVAWYAYTGGDVSGTVQNETLPPGNYVARAYYENSYVRRFESTPFTVEAPLSYPVTLSTDKTSYGGLEPIMVTYAGMAGSGTDWVGTVGLSEDSTSIGGWAWTVGAASTAPIYGAPFGTWEIRAFFDGNFLMKGRTGTTVTVSAGVRTDKASYTAAEQILVHFGGMLGTSTDWVSIANAGSAATQLRAFKYTRGKYFNGVYFDAASLGAGTYVARAYFENDFTLRAESATFTVQ